jgi:hypothetical protein
MVAAEFLRQRAGMCALNSSGASLHLKLAMLPPNIAVEVVKLLLGAKHMPSLPLMATHLTMYPKQRIPRGGCPTSTSEGHARRV